MTDWLPVIALAHAGATCAMTGILWLVQLVAYPAFLLVRPDDLPRYAAAHASRITCVVGPLMLLEAGSFVALLVLRAPVPGWLMVAAGFALVVNWASTFLWQVPLHARLQKGEASAVPRLIASNWLRTVCWTARAAAACAMVWLMRDASAAGGLS